MKWTKKELKVIEEHILENKEQTAIALAGHNTEFITPKLVHQCINCGIAVKSDINTAEYLDYHSVKCPCCDDVQKLLILNIRD
jgi:hypothetical protein